MERTTVVPLLRTLMGMIPERVRRVIRETPFLLRDHRTLIADCLFPVVERILGMRRSRVWRRPHPWFAPEAVRRLERFLRPDMNVFEYGSGGSTLFFSRRVRNVVSVEHDAEWYDRVKTHLMMRGLQHKCSLHLVRPVGSSDASFADCSAPDRYASASLRWRGYDFCGYVSFIDSFPDEYFDLIAIDGRARPACLKHAVPKLKRGGLLLLDDSERPRYSYGISLLSGWARRESRGVRRFSSWRTTVFVKP